MAEIPPAITLVAGEMQRVVAKPGDTFVLFFDEHLDDNTVERLRAQLSAEFGGAKVLVLTGGARLGIVGQSDVDEVELARMLGARERAHVEAVQADLGVASEVPEDRRTWWQRWWSSFEVPRDSWIPRRPLPPSKPPARHRTFRDE